MLIIIPPAIIMDALAGIIGLIVLAYYSSIKCDPLANGEITNLNQVRRQLHGLSLRGPPDQYVGGKHVHRMLCTNPQGWEYQIVEQ